MAVRELSNIKSEKEMKDVLMNKLRDEESQFKRSEVVIQAITNGFLVFVKGYEHCTYKISFDYDNYFGYEIWVSCGDKKDDNSFEIIYDDYSKTKYDLKHALTFIGYQIGITF